MNIVILTTHFDWFSNYQEVILAKTAANAGHKVYVICGKRPYKKFVRAGAAHNNYNRLVSHQKGVVIIRSATELRAGVVSFGLATIPLLKRIRPDLVFGMNPGQGQAVQGALYKLIVPDSVYLTYHEDNEAQYRHLSGLRKIAKRLAFFALKGPMYFLANFLSDRTLVNTPNGLRWISPVLGSKAKQEVFGVASSHEDFYYSPEEQDSIRRLHDIEPDTLIVGIVGTYSRKKKIEEFICTLSSSELPRKTPTALFIIGLFSQLPAEQVISLRHKLNNSEIKIIEKDFCNKDELRAYMCAMDVGVWPRQPAITIQQALLTGLPVVIPKDDLTSHLHSLNQVVTFAHNSLPEAIDVLESHNRQQLKTESGPNNRVLGTCSMEARWRRVEDLLSEHRE